MYIIFTHSGTRFFAHHQTIILGGTSIYFINDSATPLTGCTNIRAVGSIKEALNWVKNGTVSGVD
jgi:hypothetical protein